MFRLLHNHRQGIEAFGNNAQSSFLILEQLAIVRFVFHCFLCYQRISTSGSFDPPSYIEAMIMMTHLETFGRLPRWNEEF
jgi:hypothetical protein